MSRTALLLRGHLRAETLVAAYVFFITTPRVLVPFASLAAALGALSSCVPQSRYEEVRSAAVAQTAGSQRLQAELEGERARASALQAELDEQGRESENHSQSLAQSKLESEVLFKEREQNAAVIEQLRTELIRAGGHLHAYSEERTRLEGELSQVRAQTQALEPILLALGQELRSFGGPSDLGATVAVNDGALVLRVPAAALFEGVGAKPRPRLLALVERAAQLAQAEPRLVLRVRGAEPAREPSENAARDRHATLAQSVRERGIAERVQVAPLALEVGLAPQSYEITLETLAEGGREPVESPPLDGSAPPVDDAASSLESGASLDVTAVPPQG